MVKTVNKSRVALNLGRKNKNKTKQNHKWVLFLLFFIMIAIVITGGGFYQNNLKTQQKLEEFYFIEKKLQKEELDIDEIENFIDKYDNSLQANLLSYYTAVYYYTKNDLVEAERWLFTANIEGNNAVSNMSKFMLANIYQQNKKYEEAISIIETIDIPSLTDYLVMEIIQNNILAGDLVKAREQINNFLKQFKRSSLRSSAEKLLNLIG